MTAPVSQSSIETAIPVAHTAILQDGAAGKVLLNLVERAERLQEEHGAILSDLKDLWAEAKGTGFDIQVIKELIKRRKLDANDRDKKDEFDALLDLYEEAIKTAAGTN